MTMMRQSTGSVVLRAVAGLVGGACALVFLWLIVVIVSTDGGPHGYLLFFGGFVAFGIGLLAALVLPVAFRSGTRLVALGISLLTFVLVLIGAVALLFW